jgi:predicted RNA-binding protein with TRAM domain
MPDSMKLRFDIDSKQWKKLQEKNPDLDESELLSKILKDYIMITTEDTEEGSLFTELGEQKKLTESLRKKCKNFALRVKELEDIQEDQNGNIQKLKSQIKKISKDFPGFGDEEKVKEKIVYREDTKTIKELKEKRDALQKSIWEKNADLEKSEKSITDLEETLNKLENEKGKAYAILVKLNLNKSTSKYEFEFENISRGEFNKLMRSKVEFCKYKKIFNPASVIKLWDKEEGEEDFINLDEAVNELRNKSDKKLTEISMPYSQYENLKNFENKYLSLKEESEKNKEELKNLSEQNKEINENAGKLQRELTNIKENPIIQEKIVYKENTKELNDLKGECERLRLKLFNYETGRMSVPTHGINVGNNYKVKVLGVGKDGDGFTRVNNFIIFVPNTNKDQEVNIKITRVLKKYAFGKVIEGEPGEEVIDATMESEAEQGTSPEPPEPTKTPEPTTTPEPTETPEKTKEETKIESSKAE